MASETRQILDKLDRIQSELAFIKKQMVDIMLTDEDIQALKESEIDFKKGKTTRL